MSNWVILGCGYIGTRLVKDLLRDGESVLACARNKDLLAELEALGADGHRFEATIHRAFHHALSPLRAPNVVYAMPPMPGFPGGEIVGRAVSEAERIGAQRFFYLSSTAVYGEGQDGETVDEESPTALSDPDARAYLSAESAVENGRNNGLDAAILRLSSVYGPGRGVRERLLEGTYKLLDGGVHMYSRIHVDDVIGIIRAIADRGPVNPTYCLADDRPCTQKEYADWLTEHLGTKPPTSVPSLAPGMPRRRIRNRAVSNSKLKSDLDYAFRHPTYREGELANDQELGVEGAEASLPPLVIHRHTELASIAERSGLRRLSIQHNEVSAGDETHVSNPGEAVLYVIAGEPVALHGEETQALKVGDMVEVPPLGMQIKADENPASFLLFTTRR